MTTTTTTAPPGPMQLPATWDAVADGFAAASPWFAHVRDEVLGVLPLGPDDRVLDVAAGAGDLAVAAAARVRAVTAVDFSPAMIEHTRARAAQVGADNVQALVMDAQALALPDAS